MKIIEENHKENINVCLKILYVNHKENINVCLKIVYVKNVNVTILFLNLYIINFLYIKLVYIIKCKFLNLRY
jgi:hypothetical protein